MDEKNLDVLVNSNVPRCPVTECIVYLKFEQCHTHRYVVCKWFEDWYNELSSDKKRIFYDRKV